MINCSLSYNYNGMTILYSCTSYLWVWELFFKFSFKRSLLQGLFSYILLRRWTSDRCTHKRSSVPKLLGLVKFRLTNFVKRLSVLFQFFFFNSSIQKKIFMNTQEFCVLGLLWQLPYLHLAVCFYFLPGLLSDSF